MRVDKQNVSQIGGLVKETDKNECVVPVGHGVVEVSVLVAGHSDRKPWSTFHVGDSVVVVAQMQTMKPRVEMVVDPSEHVVDLPASYGHVRGTGKLEAAVVEAVVLDGLGLIDDGLYRLAAFAVRPAVTSVDDGASKPGELSSVSDEATAAERPLVHTESDGRQTTNSRGRAVNDDWVKDMRYELELCEWLIKSQQYAVTDDGDAGQHYEQSETVTSTSRTPHDITVTKQRIRRSTNGH